MPLIVDSHILFFPAHLRLGPTNWREYRHTVETICRLYGVEHHLFSDYLEGEFDSLEEERAAQEEWDREQALCKAIITLNIKNFPEYSIEAGYRVYARYVWDQLVRMHTRPSWWKTLFGWARPPTRLEILLFVLLLASLWLHCLIIRERL